MNPTVCVSRIYAIGIEHGIMLARVLIMIVSPIVPRWLAVGALLAYARLSYVPGVGQTLTTTTV
jgi:hypothetical protein